MTTKGRINPSGVLEISRKGRYKVMRCLHAPAEMCCDRCPAFDALHDNGVTLCKEAGEWHFDEFADERIGGTE